LEKCLRRLSRDAFQAFPRSPFSFRLSPCHFPFSDEREGAWQTNADLADSGKMGEIEKLDWRMPSERRGNYLRVCAAGSLAFICFFTGFLSIVQEIWNKTSKNKTRLYRVYILFYLFNLCFVIYLFKKYINCSFKKYYTTF